MRQPDLLRRLFAHLPPRESGVLRRAMDIAEETAVSVYLVGGPVRDLLLGHPSLDLDITVEGDGPALGRRLASELGLDMVEHPRFLTATLRAPGFVLDIATARSETYRRPGALPAVTPASIREDLVRRDFTINALALTLSGERPGALLDPAGGRADLEAGLVRVLHDRSFVDDATRILRATRYEARFGFHMHAGTEALLRANVRYLDTISGARIHHEVSRILAEEGPERALLRLDKLTVLPRIHPALSFDAERAAAFAALRALDRGAVPGAYWPLLAWEVTREGAPSFSHRLALTGAQAAAVAAVPALREAEARIADPSLRPSDAVELLSSHPETAVWALAAMTPFQHARARCVDYLERARHVRPLLRGHDVMELGVPPGPRLGEVLRRLKAAKLNGELTSRAQEEAFVKQLLQETAHARD